jgi:prolyl oligopeptidase
MALDPLATPFVFAAPGSPYLIGIVGNGNQREFSLYTAPVAALAQGVPAWRRVAGLDDEVTDAALVGSTLYLLTHRNAPHFKVVRLDLAQPDLPTATAAVVVPASDAVITGIAAGKDALYVRRMIAGVSDLLRVDHAPGAKPVSIKLPFAGDIERSRIRAAGLFNTGTWTRRRTA